jgi:helicase required for RNAi-mediated heterochromatin assembly 1
MAKEPAIPPSNNVDIAPKNKGVYLATQYKLLRYEGVELLRRAICDYRLTPTMMDGPETCIYTKVRGGTGLEISLFGLTRFEVFVRGYLFNRLGGICRISFSTERVGKRVNWQFSPRLTPGTVVALSPVIDNFRTTCLVATIAARTIEGGLVPSGGDPERSGHRIDILWANPTQAIFDPAKELVMVESRCGYFESVRHSLIGLQLAAETVYVNKMISLLERFAYWLA